MQKPNKKPWWTEKVIIPIIVGLITPLVVAVIYKNQSAEDKASTSTSANVDRKATYPFDEPRHPKLRDEGSRSWLTILGQGLQGAQESLVVTAATKDLISSGKGFVGRVPAPNQMIIEKGLAFIVTEDGYFSSAKALPTKDRAYLEVRVPDLKREGRLLILVQMSGQSDPSRPLHLNDLIVENF